MILSEEIFVVGICGGSASGKSHAVKLLGEALHPEAISILDQDSYYHDFSAVAAVDRAAINFDHPEAIDFHQLVCDLKQLKSGIPVQKPLYDFQTHTRKHERQTVPPARLLVVEGLHVLHVSELRELLDLKVYIDIESDVRLIRRLLRDTETRGRTVEHVINQYLQTVRPMEMEFVRPCKNIADMVIGLDDFDAGVGQIASAMIRVVSNA